MWTVNFYGPACKAEVIMKFTTPKCASGHWLDFFFFKGLDNIVGIAL